MLRAITQFKSIIQEIECTFHFDTNCPTHIAKEALFECLKWVGQIEDQAKANQEEKKDSEESEKEEEKKEVIDEQPALGSEL